SAARRFSICCRCSQAMSRPLTPISANHNAISVSSRKPRSMRAFPASSPGTARITASEGSGDDTAAARDLLRVAFTEPELEHHDVPDQRIMALALAVIEQPIEESGAQVMPALEAGKAIAGNLAQLRMLARPFAKGHAEAVLVLGQRLGC